jgi:hypothetical protein
MTLGDDAESGGAGLRLLDISLKALHLSGLDDVIRFTLNIPQSEKNERSSKYNEATCRRSKLPKWI